MTNLSDAVRASRNGSLEAYGAVVEMLESRAISYACHLLGNYTDAEDAAQESFIQAWQKLGALKEDAAFTGWFYQILTNTVRRRFRGTRKFENIDDYHYCLGDGERDPQVLYQEREWKEQVRRAVHSLPEHQRAVVLLRDSEEFSYEEIAKILQIPLGTVKSRLYLARERLGQVLGGQERKDVS